jgi:hypothetical protein
MFNLLNNHKYGLENYGNTRENSSVVQNYGLGEYRMKQTIIWSVILLAVVWAIPMAMSQEQNEPGKFEQDVIKTDPGDLKITCIGHGTLMMELGEKVIHIDPWTKLADYTKFPKADIILITHDHGDHLDSKAIDLIKKADTQILASKSCEGKIEGAVILENGQSKDIAGIKIEAVPAYNIEHKRHPVSSERKRQRLCDYIRQDEGLCGRRYGKHPGDEVAQRYRCCVFTDEPALYDDPGNGRRRSESI